MAAAAFAAASTAAGLWLYSCVREGRYRRRSDVGVRGWQVAYDVHVARTVRECDAAVAAILDSLYSDEAAGRKSLHSPRATGGARNEKVIGLDCEWVMKGKVAVLQLATHDTVGVFQLQWITKSTRDGDLPASLEGLLERVDVYKTGAAVDGDVRRLAKDYGVAVSPWVCVQRLAAQNRALLAGALPPTLSLQALAAALCGIELEKSHAVRCMGWEQEHLTARHIRYATADAVASREVAMSIVYRVQQDAVNAAMAPPPPPRGPATAGGAGDASPPPAAAGESSPSSPAPSPARLLEEPADTPAGGGAAARLVVLCTPPTLGLHGDTSASATGVPPPPPTALALDGLPRGADATPTPPPDVDMLRPLRDVMCVKYHGKKLAMADTDPDAADGPDHIPPSAGAGASSGGKAKKKEVSKFHTAKAERAKKIVDTLQRPAYSNCLILAPDNEPLVCCDQKKADWYVRKGRAEVVEREPRWVIRLLFEPIARNTVAEQIQNRCVVCGRENKLLKHHVVPMCYRKEFPRHRKDHQPHDVVLLCKPCSTSCQMHYGVLRKHIEAECDVAHDDHYRRITRAAASALIMLYNKAEKCRIPSEVMDDGHNATVVEYPANPPPGVMPPQRFEELSSAVAEHVRGSARLAATYATAAVAGTSDDADAPPSGVVEMTVGTLRATIDDNTPPPAGRQVTAYYVAKHGLEDGITELIKKWRGCFVERMRPRYLPDMWSVDHVFVDERLKYLVEDGTDTTAGAGVAQEDGNDTEAAAAAAAATIAEF